MPQGATVRRSPAAILGGGPSLPKDLKRLPEDCLLIAVNDHAFHHCGPHVLVYQDRLSWSPRVADVMEDFSGVVVCPWKNSHVKLPVDWWDANQSSCLATWYACWMGFSPVILCGMDCYQGDVKYCHPVKYNPALPIFNTPLNYHLDLWRGAFEACPHPERIRAMSGPLVEVFGKYEVNQ